MRYQNSEAVASGAEGEGKSWARVPAIERTAPFSGTAGLLANFPNALYKTMCEDQNVSQFKPLFSLAWFIPSLSAIPAIYPRESGAPRGRVQRRFCLREYARTGRHGKISTSRTA